MMPPLLVLSVGRGEALLWVRDPAPTYAVQLDTGETVAQGRWLPEVVAIPATSGCHARINERFPGVGCVLPFSAGAFGMGEWSVIRQGQDASGSAGRSW